MNKQTWTLLLAILALLPVSGRLYALDSNTQMYGLFETASKAGGKFLGKAQVGKGSRIAPEMIMHASSVAGIETEKAVYSNGVIYSLNYDAATYIYNNQITLYTLNGLTGEQLAPSQSLSDRYFARAMAANPVTGEVWGLFNANSAHDRWDICCVDFRTLERRSVGVAKREYVCMGMNMQQELFGFAEDGNLYRISTEDGSDTLIGATGLTNFVDAGGMLFPMSGAINPDDGLFYISFADNNFQQSNNGMVVTVDTKTGRATKLNDYAQIFLARAVYFPVSSAEDTAPSAVSDLTLNFPKDAVSGTVSFTMPSASFAGGALLGSHEYVIRVDGVDTEQGNASIGGQVTSKTITFAKEGLHAIQVFAKNTIGGEGAKVYKIFYVGLDKPTAPANVRATVAADGQTTISWNTPTGIFGGWAGDETTFTYTVTRYPDGKVLGTAVTGNTLTDKLDPAGDTEAWYYGVKANSTRYEDVEEGFSPKTIFGAPLDVPYTADFANIDLLTFIDVQDDGRSFSTSNLSTGRVMGQYGGDGSTLDDWLILPRINLEKGVHYRFTFPRVMWSAALKLTLAYGSEPTPEAMVNVIASEQKAFTNEFEVLTYDFTASESGTFHIGVHSVQDNAPRGLYMTQPFRLEEVPGPGVPAAPTGVSAVGGDRGAKSVKLSLTAPSVLKDGSSAAGTLSVKVLYRNRVVHTFTNVNPGDNLEWTFESESIANGVNTFSVAAVNSDGTGEYATVNVYVGVDVPQSPTGLKQAASNGETTLTWDAVAERGAQGYYVDPETVTYYIYDYSISDDGFPTPYVLIGEVTGQTSFSFQESTGEGDQGLVYKAVRAGNAAGLSGYVAAPPMVVGTPYNLPFDETLAGGTTNSFWWYDNTNATNAAVIGTSSYDSGSGSFSWTAAKAKEYAYVNTGKISLRSASNKPVLSFAYFAEPGNTQMIDAFVQTPDGNEVRIARADYSSLHGEDRWMTSLTDLSAYKDQDYIIVKFRLYGGTRNDKVQLDAISVYDLLQYNLRTDISAPAVVKAGANAGVSIIVRNTGENEIKGFKVTLYADDEEVFAETVDEPIAPQAVVNVATDYRVPADSEDDYVELRAEVEALGSPDLNGDDDWVTIELEVREATAARPEAVTHDVAAGKVTWQTPGTTTEPVVETFDDFTSYSTAGISQNTAFGWLNDWLVFDGDREETDNFTINYPNRASGEKAWMVWDTATANDEAPAELFGKKYLVAFNPIIGAANDWLVSPTLSGKAQIVELSVASIGSDGKGTVELLYTTSSVDPASLTSENEVQQYVNTFHSVVRKQLSTTDWDTMSADVPEGATRLAVRNVSSNGVAVALALVSYEKGNPAPVSFNIYQDGKLVANVKAADDLSYVVTEASAVYAVSAVYANGEESKSVEAANAAGIRGLTVDGADVDVYSLDGKLLRAKAKTLDGLKKGLYVIGNRVVVVK